MKKERIMTLSNKWILVNEIVEKTGVASSNFSPLQNDENHENKGNLLKFKSFLLLNKDGDTFPKYIQEMIQNYEYTSLEGLIPYPKFDEDLGLKYFDTTFYDTKVICGKKFIDIKDKQMKKNFSKYIPYIIDKDELEEVKNDIKGYIEVKKDKYLVWY